MKTPRVSSDIRTQHSPTSYTCFTAQAQDRASENEAGRWGGASGEVGAHDNIQGEASSISGLTPTDIRRALQANASWMLELGLAWVQRTPAQVQADVDASAATAAAALRTVLDAATAAAAAQTDIHAATFREVAASLESLSQQVHTRIGRQTYQTVLSAVAGTGEHAFGVPLETRAERLGVRRTMFLEARGRMQHARHDIHPSAALAADSYVYVAPKTRRNATSQELQAMMRQYWHRDDVSRESGEPTDEDAWRESNARDVPSHPRRQLIVEGGWIEVYRSFLLWPLYLAYKMGQGEGFTDPGRRVFMATRCPCLSRTKPRAVSPE